MQIRRRQDDGTFGPLEEVFPSEVDETLLMLLEALAGQQEQIEQLQAEVDKLKGGVA